MLDEHAGISVNRGRWCARDAVRHVSSARFSRIARAWRSGIGPRLMYPISTLRGDAEADCDGVSADCGMCHRRRAPHVEAVLGLLAGATPFRVGSLVTDVGRPFYQLSLLLSGGGAIGPAGAPERRTCRVGRARRLALSKSAAGPRAARPCSAQRGSGAYRTAEGDSRHTRCGWRTYARRIGI